MQYLNEKTQQVVEMLENLNPELEGKDMVHGNIFSGSEYLQLAQQIDITKYDMLVGCFPVIPRQKLRHLDCNMNNIQL